MSRATDCLQVYRDTTSVLWCVTPKRGLQDLSYRLLIHNSMWVPRRGSAINTREALTTPDDNFLSLHLLFSKSSSSFGRGEGGGRRGKIKNKIHK